MGPNPDHKYSGCVAVDSFSGAVTSIERNSAMNLKDDEEIVSMISPAQAINIAKEVLQAYFPFLPIDSFSINTTPETINNGASWKEMSRYIFVDFDRIIQTPSGEKVVIGVQRAFVALNSETGEWWSIDCGYEPIEISPIPSISTEEAVQSAISFLYALGAEYVEVEGVSDEWTLAREKGGGPQRIVKIIALEQYPGYYGQFEGCGARVIVDGHTGEVLDASFAFGGASFERKTLTLVFNGREQKWKQNPVVKNGEIYISLDDIKAMGFKVVKSGKNYVISFKKGKAVVSGSEILWIKGKPFIRSSSLGKIKGIKVKYLKEFKVLNIWVMNEKGYLQGKKEALRLKNQRREQQ